MKCCDVDQRIDAYLDGELPEGESGRLTGHISECERCGRQYAALLQTVQALEELPDIEAPAQLIGDVLSQLPARLAKADRERAPVRAYWRIGWSIGMAGAVAAAGFATLMVCFARVAPASLGPVLKLGKVAFSPIAEAGIWLLNTIAIVVPTCGQVVAYGLIIDIILLASCIIAVKLWHRRAVPVAAFAAL